MRTVIAGSRQCVNEQSLLEALSYWNSDITTILCGKASGADTLGELFGKENNIPIEYYPANWSEFGKSAGYIRNEEMAKNAEVLICLWDGISPGSKNMIKLAKKYKLKYLIYNFTTKQIIEINE